MMARAAAAEAAQTPVQPGEVEIRARVTLTVALGVERDEQMATGYGLRAAGQQDSATLRRSARLLFLVEAALD